MNKIEEGKYSEEELAEMMMELSGTGTQSQTYLKAKC